MNIGKNVKAGELLEKIRETHKLILCAGPYAWPYTTTTNYPRGFDIEIMERIAANEDLYLEIYWAEQKMRGGLSKALRHSIGKGRCHIYMGLTTSDSMAEEVEEKNLVYTLPYLGVAYIPIANPDVPDFVQMEEIKGKFKPGVAMSTAIDGYFFYNGYDRDLWARKPTEIDGVATQEIPIAFIMSTQVAKARKKYKDITVYKSLFTPLKLTLTQNNEKSFIKLITNKKTNLVIGAHMVGENAGEIMQGIAIAIKAGATKDIFDSTIGIHPTLAEEFVTMRNSK